jgi:hypothetical protein
VSKVGRIFPKKYQNLRTDLNDGSSEIAVRNFQKDLHRWFLNKENWSQKLISKIDLKNWFDRSLSWGCSSQRGLNSTILLRIYSCKPSQTMPKPTHRFVKCYLLELLNLLKNYQIFFSVFRSFSIFSWSKWNSVKPYLKFIEMVLFWRFSKHSS